MRGEMPEEHNAALKRQRVLRDEACARVFALEKERDDALAALRGGDDAQNDASIERRDDDAKLRRVEAHVVKALCMEVVARGSVIETLKAAHAEKPVRTALTAAALDGDSLVFTTRSVLTTGQVQHRQKHCPTRHYANN